MAIIRRRTLVDGDSGSNVPRKPLTQKEEENVPTTWRQGEEVPATDAAPLASGPTAEIAPQEQEVGARQAPTPSQPPHPAPPPEATETSIEEWLNQLLVMAIDNRASDVHFETNRDKFDIRARIDGMLHSMESLDASYQEPVISRIKVLGQMDITKHRLPQDGGFEFSHNERVFSIRVATYPTIYGEVAVLRILNRSEALLDLSALGFDAEQLRVMNALIKKPYGMILITGPSGSGKTTLLYSILNTLKTPENNIITIEDPVEVQMTNIRQAEVNQYQDFNFPAALRSVLRQDPDIVMVGEIRDKETAQISVQAALTGRLILSTFHTLNVFAVVTRLIEMGIPRSVVAHTIEGIVSSRLVRKVCPKCKVPHTPTESERAHLTDHVGPNDVFQKGEGCQYCVQTGYHGRIGIFEVVAFDDDIRQAILNEAPSHDLFVLLRQKQIKSLAEAAMDKVREGTTTIEEVIRVTGEPTGHDV